MTKPTQDQIDCIIHDIKNFGEPRSSWQSPIILAALKAYKHVDVQEWRCGHGRDYKRGWNDCLQRLVDKGAINGK